MTPSQINVKSPQHAARSTQHAARSTQHAARSTQHAARSTKPSLKNYLDSSLLKKLSLSLIVSAPLLYSPQASAVDGCKALLCFAGGMAIPECQSTIKEVIHDLSRGRAFPTCGGASAMGITSRRGSFTQSSETGRFEVTTCPDGSAAHFVRGNNDSGWSSRCKYIDVNLPEDIAADGQHLNQRHYY